LRRDVTGHQQFDAPASDVRTAIIYGIEAEETRAGERPKTRFDFDCCFGTVADRSPHRS
jgi:hypothetical protein